MNTDDFLKIVNDCVLLPNNNLILNMMPYLFKNLK